MARSPLFRSVPDRCDGVDGGVFRFALRALAARQRNDVLGGLGVHLGLRLLIALLLAGALARRRVGIEGRPLVAGAPAQHVAQLKEDHNGRDQEEDRPEIEESHLARQ